MIPYCKAGPCLCPNPSFSSVLVRLPLDASSHICHAVSSERASATLTLTTTIMGMISGMYTADKGLLPNCLRSNVCRLDVGLATPAVDSS